MFKHWKLWVLVGLSLALYFWMLGSTTLWDYSEPEYAQVIKEMVQGNHWLTLHYNGTPYFTHPPLFYWLTALVAKAFGFSEWVMRSVAAFFGAMIVLLVYGMGRRWVNEKVAWLAALVSLSMFHPFVMGRLVGIDSLLNFLLMVSVFSFFEFYSTRKKIWLILFYVGQVLAVLAKGPYGFFMPWAIGVIFLASEAWKFTKPQKKRSKKLIAVLKKFWNFLKLYQIFWAVPVSVVLGMSWYGYETYVHGMPFVNTMFGEFLWGRVFGAVQGQKGPLWYYLPVIFLGLFPWFLMLPRGLKFLWNNRSKPEWLYVSIILGFNLLFFSLSGTKLPNYLALCFPFMALVIGYNWNEFFKSKKRFGGAQNLALVFLILQTLLLGALLYFALTQVYTQATQILSVELQKLLIVTAGVSALAVLMWLIPKIPMRWTFYVLTATGLIFTLFLSTFFLPAAEPLKTAPAMMRYLKSHMRPSDALYVVDVASPSTVFYFDRKINTVSYDQLKNLMRQPQKIYVLYRENDYAQRYQKDRSLRQFHLKTMGAFTAVSNQP